MGQPKMKWYGPEVIAKVLDLTGDRIERAAREFRDFTREQVSKVGGPSMPWQYPHKQEGQLRRNIQMELDRSIMTARIGTNVLYGKFLELGTANPKKPHFVPELGKMVSHGIRPRPWLSKALVQFRVRLRQILGRG